MYYWLEIFRYIDFIKFTIEWGFPMDEYEFDYYTDEDFAWVGIEQFYKSPTFNHKKGTHFKLEIVFDKEFENHDKEILPPFLKNWAFGEDRYIKPFTLIDFSMNNCSFVATFKTIRKSKKFDEIKFLLIDVVAVYKSYEYNVQSLKVELVSS